MQTPLPRKGQTHTSLLFGSPRQSLRVPLWPSKRRGGQRRPTFCSGSGVGTTPGLQRRDHGYGRHERDPHASGRRRLLRRLLVRCATGFSPSFPHSSRKTVSPRTFRGHSLQLGRVFESGGWALDSAIIFCAKCGAVYLERADALCRGCSEIPGSRTSQLRKLRSGLFPKKKKKRYPVWTVEHVRRSTLDEATTLVAQLESCEAGLGRTVMEPTTPKKQLAAPQAAVLAHWERVGEAVKTRTWRCSVSTSGGRVYGRRMGSTISWCQSLPSRLVVLALTTAAYRGGCGQSGAVVPLCMRRAVHGALRLGRGGAWLTQSQVWQTGVAADTQGRLGEGSPGWGNGIKKTR